MNKYNLWHNFKPRQSTILSNFYKNLISHSAIIQCGLGCRGPALKSAAGPKGGCIHVGTVKELKESRSCVVVGGNG